jgi:drug/metabolite transporter (DMT)-like permease
VLLGLAAAVSFGLSAPLAKRLLGDVSSAQLLAGVLYLGACGALVVGRRFRRDAASEARLRRSDLPALGGLILSGGVIAPVLLLLGLQRLGGAQGSLLLNLEGPATLALAVLVFREHLDRRALVAAAAIFGGAALLSWVDPSGVRDGVGVVCVAGACVRRHRCDCDAFCGRARSLDRVTPR